MKKCLNDVPGIFIKKSNSFEPVYNYYRMDNRFVIKIESPGNFRNIEADVRFTGEYKNIKIREENIKDKEQRIKRQ